MAIRDRVVVADILRPRGNRGELLVRSQTDVPGRLESLRNVQVRLQDGSEVSLEVTEVWSHKEDWVVKFAGVNSINDAERFRHSELWVPLSERGVLPDGDMFRSDLIGCSVVDCETGQVLGTVDDWQDYGGPLLLQMKRKDREVLIPLVDSICRQVDVANRSISVALPDGLLEL